MPTWSGRRRGMTKRRQAVQVSGDQSFKGRQFTAEVIRWGGLVVSDVSDQLP
jgi:hypothetical protein